MTNQWLTDVVSWSDVGVAAAGGVADSAILAPGDEIVVAATWLLLSRESVWSPPGPPFSVSRCGNECTFAYVWEGGWAWPPSTGDDTLLAPPPPEGACKVCDDELEFSWLFDFGRNVFFSPSKMFLLGFGDPPMLAGEAPWLPLCVLPSEPGAVFLFSSLGFSGPSLDVGLVGQEVFLSSSCLADWSPAPVGSDWGACFPDFPPLWAGCDCVFRSNEFFDPELVPNSGADLKETPF